MKESIIGNKVILRAFHDEDAAFFAYWYNQPEVMFQCGFVQPTTLETELETIRINVKKISGGLDDGKSISCINSCGKSG